MSELNKEMLERLASRPASSNSDNIYAQVAASEPKHNPSKSADSDSQLDQLLSRINQQIGSGNPTNACSETVRPALRGAVAQPANLSPEEFIPTEPTTFGEAGLSDSAVESLVFKFLLARGSASGREISEQVKLPFVMIDELLRQMKHDQVIAYKGSAAMNDYVCQLSDLGRERARRHSEHCTYFGAAPVSLEDYIASVSAQSLDGQQPTEKDLKDAFSDLLINHRMFARLGPAINSGRGMFLFGYPGNGKTSIAERVTRTFGQTVWIPRAISIDGEIMRLFDPMNHEEMPLERTVGLLDSTRIDRRWVRIRRPTIVAGGELTMANLEVHSNPATNINEAPLQLKSNLGTLVIDDFGRQKMSTDELLNRWIVPLEKRYDFLNMSNGKKVQVPFDQLIVFSTNLEPKDLVDEAFLRRIPYKIEVIDPTEQEFRELFRIMCPGLGFEYNEPAIDYLIDKHYKSKGRPFRCCQPRDLLLQVKNHCLYQQLPLMLSPEAFDFAAENYFSVM